MSHMHIVSLHMVELLSAHAADVALYPHERSPLGFLRWQHSVGGAERCRHSKLREKCSWGYRATSTASSATAVGGTHRRHSVGAP